MDLMVQPGTQGAKETLVLLEMTVQMDLMV
jgi:hypothetical protein